MDVHDPPLFTDYDDVEHVVLATSHNLDGLRRLETFMLERLFGRQMSDHLGEVSVHTGYPNLLLVRKDVWDSRPLDAWVRHSQYALGWVDALDLA